MNNEEVIVVRQVLELVETMEEGLFYIEDRLKAFDIKSTYQVLLDLIEAFANIEVVIESFDKQLGGRGIQVHTDNLKATFNRVVSEYEEIDGPRLIQTVEMGLVPAFIDWKTELEAGLRPYVLS